jgi:hypothetical protein
MVSSCLYAADEEFPSISWCIYGLSMLMCVLVAPICILTVQFTYPNFPLNFNTVKCYTISISYLVNTTYTPRRTYFNNLFLCSTLGELRSYKAYRPSPRKFPIDFIL